MTWRPEDRLTGGERWPQSYLDPTTIRREQIEGALQTGALIAFWSSSTLYIVHAGEIVPEETVHQTTYNEWLRNTKAPRIAPIAGLSVSLRA